MAVQQVWENIKTGELVEYYKRPGAAYKWRVAHQNDQRRFQEQKGRKKQEKREKLGISALQKAIALFDKDFGKGMEARARASASSAAVTSGLGGTTRPGAVSAGLSAEFEDMRRGRLSGALGNLSSFLGSYRDPYAVTPQVSLGQQQLGQQGRQAEQQLGFNYAQLGQQGRQFGAELELGYAGLNARRSQPAPAPTISAGRSIWPDKSNDNTEVPSIDWQAAEVQANKEREELYQGGWTG